jgi:PhnB protein
MQPIPEGYHTITPYIVVKDARGFIEFMKKAFGAEEIQTSAGDDGTVYNSELRIGTSMLMTADARDHAVKPSTLYLYLADPDQVYAQALKAGAKSICPMTDQFYGDRSGGVEDAWGVQWWLSKRVKTVSAEEIARFKDKK